MEPQHNPNMGHPPPNPYAQNPPVGSYPNYPPGGYAQPPPMQPYGGQPMAPGYNQPMHSNVVISQPGGFAPVTNVMAAPPNNMVLSILTCLFCFWPLGLVAIFKSNEVDNAMRRGDVVAANAASQSARRFSMWSIGFGVAAYIIIVVIVIIQVAVVSSTYSTY